MKTRFFIIFAAVVLILCGSGITADAQDNYFESPIDTTALTLDEFYEYANSDTILRVAVVLSDIYGKKDMEFTRGFLLGMQNSDLPSNSVSLKVVNGEIPIDSLNYELSLFGPHVIVSTFEKDTPDLLKQYAAWENSYLVNVFDTKVDNGPSATNCIQVLSPSDKFNSSIFSFITDNFGNNRIVMVGDPDLSDPVVRDIILSWPEEELMIVSKEDISAMSLSDGINYLIYPLFSSADDIKKITEEVLRMIAETPTAGVRILGKPNWIAFNNLKAMLENLEVYIPAKCYFNPSSEKGKHFISTYNSSFGHAPIRSFPVYAAMGYDTSAYFLPRLLNQLRTGEEMWTPEDLYQSYFNIQQNADGNYANQGAFMLHFEPWGTLSKITMD